MSIHQNEIVVPTSGRGFVDCTAMLAEVVRSVGVDNGLCNVFLRHTSASLVIQENADPEVQHDLEQWMAHHIPDGDPRYRHVDEGPDDMPSHIRAALTATSLTLPVHQGRFVLGTWQAVYLYEHRHGPHRRKLFITVMD